jgi:hypothetical protein
MHYLYLSLRLLDLLPPPSVDTGGQIGLFSFFAAAVVVDVVKLAGGGK